MNPAILAAKQKNARRILDYIIKCGETSRVNIAAALNLSTATVTNIINDLLAANLVYEGRQDNAPVGRKATFIHFNEKLYYIIAVSLSNIGNISLSVCSLLGEPINSKEYYIDLYVNESNTITMVLKSIIDTVSSFIESQEEDIKSKLCAVALSIPGMVNKKQIVNAPSQNWKNMNLASPLQAATKLPVYLENVTRIKAIYEMRYINPEDKNVIYITLSPGIGIVNFFDGKMIMGRNGIAGEAGHMTLNLHGVECYCGNRGCFECYCGEINILKKAEKLLEKDNRCNILFDLVENKHMPLTMNTLFEARNLGSLKVHELLSEAGEYLGAGLVSLFNCFDPDKIIISGAPVEGDSFLLDVAVEEAKSRIISKFSRDFNIQIATLKTEELHKGICAFVLNKLLDKFVLQIM
ncbi:MAG TPA: ROK family protein [Clostridiaceae bacterium]|nr:ROK family protein [Clostridiaceae bacterium]